ncbi:YegP family protein [Pseudodesulfovibrio thermohalotolerans]|uniref:YegP family protein n=1 Tax=Pseudodesulfovibrio thermohalotolerans TaxID=2880651 RepID=UPI002442764E|nr:YegP family protein [Pseudodesulfovibrio thermohalotolerans]WFS62195.1 YegP family protein [Pseudodesulfovibrio thermohalotolerans]
MAGKYERKQAKDEQWMFNLKAGNGEIILTSELYTTKGACDNGIASVQKNSPLDERYERKEAKNGKPYFVLKAGNHQVIGKSEMYSSKSAMENGINSVKTNGPSTNIVDA